MKIIESFGFKVFSDQLSLIPITNKKCRTINTISPNSYGISTKDILFKNALTSSNYLVLDGVYFALAAIFSQLKFIKANRGPNVFYHFINRLNNKNKKAFFLGSKLDTLKKIKKRAEIDYSNVIIDYYSPPFKEKFSPKDNRKMIKKINDFKPDILFIGMTCPKQEKWAEERKNNLDTYLIITIGNVFDWYAGTQKSISSFWFKIKLAWLIRIIYRPEIFKRNIGNQMLFFGHVILNSLKIKKYD